MPFGANAIIMNIYSRGVFCGSIQNTGKKLCRTISCLDLVHFLSSREDIYSGVMAVCVGISRACLMTTAQRKQQSRPSGSLAEDEGGAGGKRSSRSWVVGRASHRIYETKHTDDSELGLYSDERYNPHQAHAPFPSHDPTTMPSPVA